MLIMQFNAIIKIIKYLILYLSLLSYSTSGSFSKSNNRNKFLDILSQNKVIQMEYPIDKIKYKTSEVLEVIFCLKGLETEKDKAANKY